MNNNSLLLKDRFELKIERIPECGCWIWMDLTSANNRYGHIRINDKKVAAHRLSWELYNGSIPDGLCVLHRCDTPSCVNPYHLFLGTQKDNAIDRENKNRHHIILGENNSMAKLTEQDILSIISDPRKQSEIARQYKIHQTHVSRIKNNHSWTHIKKESAK